MIQQTTNNKLMVGSGARRNGASSSFSVRSCVRQLARHDAELLRPDGCERRDGSPDLCLGVRG